MSAALTAVFYASAIAGLSLWAAATRASGATVQRLVSAAGLLLASAGLLGLPPVGVFFLVLAALCFVSAARMTRVSDEGAARHPLRRAT